MLMDHQPKITLDEIAQQLGLSKTTVSRALSGKGRVSRKTREKVTQLARSLGYAVPPPLKPEAHPTGNLSLVIPHQFVQLDLPFLRRWMGGISRMAGQRGYDLLMCYADESDTGQLQRQLAAGKADGVILSRTLLSDPCLELVRQYAIPCVAAGRLADENALQVSSDYEAAAREMTRMLLQSGARRIAFLGGNLNYTVNADRLAGFRRGITEAGLPLDEALVFTGVETEEQRTDALDAALEQRPDCLLCGDDSLTLSALKGLRQKEISIPEQLRLASLYDSEGLAEASPPITAVHFDAAALGAAACRLLLDFMAGRDVFPRQMLEYQVIFRQSTK